MKVELTSAGLSRAGLVKVRLGATGLVGAGLLVSACGLLGAVGGDQASSGQDTTGFVFEPNAVVIEVVDGDTIDAVVGGNRTLVRFLGIDTPEKAGGFLPAECFGETATARTVALIPPGTLLYLERGVDLYDRYDRLLAYLYRASDGLHINYELVRSGYADVLTFDSDEAYSVEFERAAAKAREAGLGLWGHCGGPDVRLTAE